MDNNSTNPPSLQDINYDSDSRIFDQSFFTLVNLYAKNQEIMKLTSLDIKERPSPDLILRELLNSRLPGGKLTYPIEIQDIISNCISSFISEPFEGMSLFERRFAIIDQKIADHFQKNSSDIDVLKKKSKESEPEIAIENSLSGIMFFSFANTIDFSNASTDFTIDFLKSIEGLLRQQINKPKFEVSKNAIISTKKIFRQIYSNEQLNNIPELNYLTQDLSFLLAKILNSVSPLISHFGKMLKCGNSIRYNKIDFDSYLPPVEATFCKNRIILDGVNKIRHISYASLQMLAVVTDDNSLYFINISDLSYSKRENFKVSCDLFAISPNFILEKDSSKEFTFKLRSIDQKYESERVIDIPQDQKGQLLFVWGDNDIFHFVTELETDKFGYFHFKAPDGKMSDMKTIHFKFPKGPRKLTNVINLENGCLLMNFDNSPFDIEYDLEKGLATKELGSTFSCNENCISTTYRGEQYTYTRGNNEIYLNISANSLIPHFQDSRFNPKEQNKENNNNNNNSDNKDDLSNEEYMRSILNAMKFRLIELLDKIISDATLSALPYLPSSSLNKFFTEDAKSTIDDILPICFDIISSNPNSDIIEFLDILLLILISCLYSNENDLEEQQRLKILDLYNKIFISDLPIKNPQLQTHIILSLALSMHTLLADDYESFKNMYDLIIKDQERLNNFQNSNCMLILCQTPAVLCIVDENFFRILLDHFPSKIVQSLTFKIINCFFKEISSVKSHKIPKNFLDALIPYLMGCAYQSYDSANDYFKILFQIAIQMISLKDNFLPFAFAEIVAPKLPLIYQNLIAFNIPFKDSEIRYSDLVSHDYRKKTVQYVFETVHYTNQRPAYQTTYPFPGASEIHVIFDKKCRVTPQTDFTIEYVDFNGNKVIKKITSDRNHKQGIPDFTIPSNSVTINYRTNRYQYAWGVKVTFKADILHDKFDFAPNFTQFLFSYFTHLIGKYLGCGLMSLPMTEREEECKVLLQSNILQHTTPDQMLLTTTTNHPSQENPEKEKEDEDDQNESDDLIKRKSISKGLSFNISPVTSFPSEMLKTFLNDINSTESKKNGAAEALFEHMYKKVPCRHRTRIIPEISAVERASAAVILKHLGVATEALSYARILQTEPNTPVPPNLHRIWQALYKIRLQLYNLLQQTKINSNNNNNNNDKESLFTEKINECLLKCNFLLNNEPILRIMINESKENYEKKQTMEIAINELVNFIMSSVKFTEIMALVELRKERFAIRMRALALIHQLSKELGMVTNAALINSIIPIITHVLQDQSDTNSLPLSMINEFNQSISALFTHFIDSFLDEDKPLLVRLTYANALSAPFIQYFNDEQIEKTINDLKTLLYESILNNYRNNDNNNNNNNNDDISVSKHNLKSFGEVICMLIAKMSLSVSSNILPLFSSFLKDKSLINEEVTNLLILIMTYLIQSHPEFQFNDIKYLLKMLSNEKILPRVASSIFYFIGQYLCSSNVNDSMLESFKFKVDLNKMNFNGFIKLILRNIGKAYLTGELEIIQQTSSLKECNLYIADEMISFIRLLLSPISKVSNEVQSILHEITSDQIEKRTPEAAGCFLVLGFGVHSLKYSSNAVLTSKKAKSNKVIVQQYIPEVGKYIISQNGESVAYDIDKTKPFAQPHTEIPTSFVLTEKECESISKILLNFDDSLFTSFVASYLPIAVQIKENSENLLKHLPFDALLKMSLSKTHDKSFSTINQLCDDILFEKNKFGLSKDLISLSGLNVVDNIAEGTSLYSIDAQSYEIEVINPGNNFYFGFMSENQFISQAQHITEVDTADKYLKFIQSRQQSNNRSRNQRSDSDSDSDSNDEDENQTTKKIENEAENSDKENLLNSFSKRHYHIISPSKNYFVQNNKCNQFPFGFDGKSSSEVKSGDKFICTLFENTVYFTFCNNDRTFYLKSSNSSFIPIISTKNSILKVTPLEKPAEAPKYGNNEAIDLSVARYSVKKDKIKKLEERNERRKKANKNEQLIDNMMESIFNDSDEESTTTTLTIDEQEEVIIQEEEEDDPRYVEEIRPSESFNIPFHIVTPVEPISTDDSLINSMQMLIQRSSSNSTVDENNPESIEREDQDSRRNTDDRPGTGFTRGRRDRERSIKSINRRKKNRNLKKKLKKINTFKFREPMFIGSTVQINKIKTMICNRKGEVKWDEDKNHLFNQVGTITLIETDNKQNSIVEVEFIDKTTGKRDSLKINSNLINVLSIPSINQFSSKDGFGKEKRKSFSIRMLRYATILALENKIDCEDDRLQLKEITKKEDFTNLLILLCLELISPNYGKDNMSSFSTKLVSCSNLLLSIQRRKTKCFIPTESENEMTIPNSLLMISSAPSTSSLLMYSDLVVPGHQKTLTRHLFGILKILSDSFPDFITTLLEKVVQLWPSLSFDEFLKYAPSQLNFDIPHITKRVNLNFTYTDTSCVGYFFIISPDSNLTGQNVLHITGDEKYKQEITNFKPSILCNCFTTDKKITVTKKFVPSKKDKLHFAIIPMHKHICGTFSSDDVDGSENEDLLTVLKSPSSYLHIYRIIVNLSLSLISSKKQIQSKFYRIFVNDLIPSIVKKLKENDIFTLAIYYDTLSTLLQQLDFQNDPLPMSINKDFDDFINTFDIFDDQAINPKQEANESNNNNNENQNSIPRPFTRMNSRGSRSIYRQVSAYRRGGKRHSNQAHKVKTPKIPLHIQQFIALKILLRKVTRPIQTKVEKKPSLLISKKSLREALDVSNYGKILTNFDEIAKCQNELPQIRPYLANAELCYSLTSSPIFPHYIILNDWISREIDDTLYTGDAFNFECTVFNPNATSLSVEIDIKAKNPDSNGAVQIQTVSSSSSSRLNAKLGRKNFRSQISMDLSSLEINILDPFTKDLLTTVPLYGSAKISSNYFNVVSKLRSKGRPSSSQEMQVRVRVSELNNFGKEKIILTHLSDFSRDVRQYETKWSRNIDESLMQLFPPSERIPGELPNDYSSLFPVLRKVDKKLLDIRVSLIQRLNDNLKTIFGMTDIKNLNLPLTQFIIKASSCISFKEKEKKIWNEVNHRNRIQINLAFNRSKAALYLNNPKNPNGKSLLSQLIGQIPISQLTMLRQPSCVPWHVDLQGEGASDAGGPGREIFSQMCNEIMDIRSGLFAVTPNRRRGSGPNQEVLIPNLKAIYKQSSSSTTTSKSSSSSTTTTTSSSSSSASSSNDSSGVRKDSAHLESAVGLSLNVNQGEALVDEEKLAEFVYIGALMACAYISKLPQPFCFSNLVWSYLVAREVSIEDVYGIDEEFYHSMSSIKMCGPDVPFSSIYSTLNFTVEDSFGETVELVKGGSFISVDYDNRLEYCRLCEEFRRNEFNLPLQKIREGMMMLLDESLSKLLCPWELRLLLCGKMEIPIDELRKVCKINAENKKLEDMLFSVLARFSSNERMLFIKFATGRMSLPPPGLSWTSPLNVRFDNRGPGNPDNKLPYAATCSSSITIPLYSSEEVMERMLRIAINYGGDIDQDNEPDLTEIVSLS